jgi:hypothetical protein
VLTCPHCNHEIHIRELPHPGFFKNFRICPNCEGCFTPDPDTKRLQAILIFILIFSLVFTLLLYFRGNEWLIPAISSYVVLGLIIYWGNKRIFLVPYLNDQNSSKNT